MPASVERCVKKVSRRKSVENAWAICYAAHNKKLKKRKRKRHGT